MINERAVDWLLKAIHRGYFPQKLRQHQKPGEIILKMPAEAREALKDLKSDDVANLRPEEWEMMGHDPIGSCNHTYSSSLVRKFKLHFDRFIKR